MTDPVASSLLSPGAGLVVLATELRGMADALDEEGAVEADTWPGAAEQLRSAAQSLQAATERAEQAEAERDMERSRFAFHADSFGDLAYDLERLKSSDWGHLRHRVMASVRAAVKDFRAYAAGQPSPSNWRRRAEEAEAKLQAADQVRLEAHAYLSRLLVSAAPQCEPLPDLPGVCSQIDNLIVGLNQVRSRLRS